MWTEEKAKGFVQNLGQAMLMLAGYGLLIGVLQNLLVLFAVPLLNFFQISSNQSEAHLMENFSNSLQWMFAGFLMFLLIGFVIAFFFRRFKKWAWYGMNLFSGITVVFVIAGMAFFYELVGEWNIRIVQIRFSVIKALVSLLSFALILTGLAIIRGLNRKLVRELFTN